MNMYKTMMKHQNTFFTCSEDVLKHLKGFHLSVNQHGLSVLKIDGKFVSSCKDEDTEDMILYYGNRQVQRNIKAL